MLHLPTSRSLFLVATLLLATAVGAQTSSEKASVKLAAVAQSSPARITLSWTSLANTTSITVYRKLKSATTWGSAIASPAASETARLALGHHLGMIERLALQPGGRA